MAYDYCKSILPNFYLVLIPYTSNFIMFVFGKYGITYNRSASLLINKKVF